MIKEKDKKSNHLETVPGVGKSIAKDLRQIGIHKVTDLINKDPQELYDDLCEKRKTTGIGNRSRRQAWELMNTI